MNYTPHLVNGSFEMSNSWGRAPVEKISISIFMWLVNLPKTLVPINFYFIKRINVKEIHISLTNPNKIIVIHEAGTDRYRANRVL